MGQANLQVPAFPVQEYTVDAENPRLADKSEAEQSRLYPMAEGGTPADIGEAVMNAETR